MDREFRLSRTKFLVSERYTLYLSWNKVKYSNPGVCSLVGAAFSGPALNIAHRIQDNQFILLDFFKQYFTKCGSIYIAKLSWGVVDYSHNGVVKLCDAKIEHPTELNKVPKFKNKDIIVIDTKNHESNVHQFNPTYNCYVTKDTGLLYNFVNPGIDTYEVREIGSV